jgi:TolA-binding protein
VPAQKTSTPDGILVQEIEIKKGDTLYDLSRKFSGRGMYFPQILLFNSIKNPNLIYEGKTLKIPLPGSKVKDSERSDARHSTAPTHSQTTSADKKTITKSEGQNADRQTTASTASDLEIPLGDLKTVEKGKSNESRTRKKLAGNVTKNKSREYPVVPTPGKQSKPPPVPKSAVQELPAVDAAVAAGQKIFEAGVKAYRKDDCRTAIELLDRYLVDNSGSPLAADANLFKAECYLKMSAQ